MLSNHISKQLQTIQTNMNKKLIRPNNRMLAGVCAGLAQYYHLPIWLVRIAFIILTPLTACLTLLIYLILYILMPSSRWKSFGKKDKTKQ